MNEDLGKNILLETINEYEGYSDDTKLPGHIEVGNLVKEHYKKNKKKLEDLDIQIAETKINIFNKITKQNEANKSTLEELDIKIAEHKKTINIIENNEYNKEVNEIKKLERKTQKILNKEKKELKKKNKIDNKIINIKYKLEIRTNKTPNFFAEIFGIHKERIIELTKKLNKLGKKKNKIVTEYESFYENRRNIEEQIKEKNSLILNIQKKSSLDLELNTYIKQREIILQEIEKGSS